MSFTKVAIYEPFTDFITAVTEARDLTLIMISGDDVPDLFYWTTCKEVVLCPKVMDGHIFYWGGGHGEKKRLVMVPIPDTTSTTSNLWHDVVEMLRNIIPVEGGASPLLCEVLKIAPREVVEEFCTWAEGYHEFSYPSSEAAIQHLLESALTP